MLEKIVTLSIKHRGIVVALWVMIVAAALASIKDLPIDAVPDVTNTQVTVLTNAPGLSPVEVERYLTIPIEMALNGLPGIEVLRSVSRTGLSSVTAIFADGVDVWFARALVFERIKRAEADIPPAYGRPELGPASTGLGNIYGIYLTSQDLSPIELRTLLDWTIAPKLRTVPGVTEVNVMGGGAKEFQIILQPKKLAAYGLSLSQIHEVLLTANGALGGGYIEKNQEAYVIRGDGLFRTVTDIENTVLSTGSHGTPVLLKNVAQVKIGAALRYGVVTKLGEGEVPIATVMMLIGANSRQVVSKVKATLAKVEKQLPPGVQLHSYYDRSEFIQSMLRTVAINLLEGAGLVLLILFLTLGSVSGALLAALAIPCAMSVAVLGMIQLGVTGNLMSLGAIDFGLLVDGCIVLLEAALAGLVGKSISQRRDGIAILGDKMRSAARPVAFSLLIILLVYCPLTTLQGVEGRMFRPMAITVALALFGSLLYALTAFPALCALFLRTDTNESNLSNRFFHAIASRYTHALQRIFPRSNQLLGAAAALTILLLTLGLYLGAEFVPRLEEGELVLDVRRLPSVSLPEAQRLGEAIEQVLAKIPEITSVVSRIGRAEVATDPIGFEEENVNCKLKPKAQWTSANSLNGLGRLIKQEIEAHVPASFVNVTQPIEDQVNTLLAGARGDLVIKVFGQDLITLKRIADTLAAAISAVPGAADVRVQRVLGLPLLNVKADRAKLARYGAAVGDILQVVEASRVGVHVGQLYEDERRFDLKLFLPPAGPDLQAFGDLLVGTPRDQLIPLASLANLSLDEGPAAIWREGLQRQVVLEVNVRDRDLISFVEEAQRTVKQIPLPPEVTLQWGGQFANFERASKRLGLVVPLALGVIFTMLFLLFGSLRWAWVIFSTVPLAAAGGCLSLFLRGLPFSIPAAVGFIAVAGVSVLNGVVVGNEVKRIQQLQPNLSLLEVILQASSHALRALLTTTAVAAIGFIPMALSTQAGAEIQRPLATVVIGGVLFAAGLSLWVLPLLLYKLLGAEQREAASADP